MILVFGSINVDLLVPVPRLPAPGETVLGGDYTLAPGGKGANQALAARRAGAAVTMAGAVGRDGFAAVALELLRQDGVDLSLVREVERPTGCAAIVVGPGGENAIAVSSGANRLVAAAQVPAAMLGPQTTLLCQMEVPTGETEKMIGRARAHGAQVILNLAPASPLDPAVLEEIDVLIANEVEAASFADRPEQLARRLRHAIVVTQGAAGSTACLAAGGRLEISSARIAAVDTTGAGDTFVGVLAAGLDERLDIELALRRASAAAALSCLAFGAQAAIPDRAAIAAAEARL